MKFKNYIWDFDGTLFDTYDFLADSMFKALRENNINADFNHVENLIRLSVTDVITYYSTQYDVKVEDIEKSYKKFSHNINYDYVKPFQNIPEILKFISANDGQNFIYTHRGKTTETILDFYDLKKYFVEIVDITYDFDRKPSPEAVNYLTDKYDLANDETLFIGDREIDILCGLNAGVKTCLFNKNLLTNQCDYFIESFNEFDDLFLIENDSEL